MGGFILFQFFLVISVAGLVMTVFGQDRWGVVEYVFFVVLLSFLSIVGSPWRQATIEKKGDRLKVLVKRGLHGISDVEDEYLLPDIKTWCYSNDTGILRMRVCSKTARPRAGYVERFSLGGIRPADLSFLPGWLGRNYSRNPSLEKK